MRFIAYRIGDSANNPECSNVGEAVLLSICKWSIAHKVQVV